jgi:hypothetical protein
MRTMRGYLTVLLDQDSRTPLRGVGLLLGLVLSAVVLPALERPA